MPIETQRNGRFIVLVTCFVLVMAGIIARAFYLQVIDEPFLLGQGDARMIRKEVIPAHRGLITDRNGMALAVSTPLKAIWINPSQLLIQKEKMGSEQIIREIAHACNLPLAILRKKINKNRHKEFLYLYRGMAPHNAEKMLSQVKAGLNSRTEYGRFYPAAEIAAHVVGMANIDEKGQEGMELSYDSWLRGTPGAKKIVRDLSGKRVKDLSLIAPAKAGNDLQLSIDMRVQHIAYRELELAVKKHRADSGSLVILDVESGEVLSMVNSPAFNPNNRSRIDRRSLRNRAVTDLFEPGSTVKAFTVAAALESGKFNANTIVKTSPIYLNRKRIEDIHYYGPMSVAKILTKSSNVGAAKLALSVGPEALSSLYQQVGLGRTTSSGYPGERSGSLPVHMRWKKIDTATLSYGYGLSVTALQLAHAYATLANSGVQYPVSLLKLDEQPLGEQVMNSVTAKKVVKMLETVVSRKGTASRAKVEGYRIAGKTGTVHLSDSEGYAENKYLSLFAGIAPASEPRVAVVVIVNNPKGKEYYGGAVSAPVFASVMKQVLPLLNIRPDNLPLRLSHADVEPSKHGEVVL
ncbi:MAG: penicillin-binding protein 2 [Gammaproteobacteria bacterium]|nr:penicillin-binding protein 2 [Gammaproteobacteria bacterium]